MSSFKAFAAWAALAALAARQQDVAPELLLLSRIRDHVRQELAHLPNYTCLETVQRFRKANGPKETMKAFDMLRQELEGHRSTRYDFRVPVRASGYTIR